MRVAHLFGKEEEEPTSDKDNGEKVGAKSEEKEEDSAEVGASWADEVGFWVTVRDDDGADIATAIANHPMTQAELRARRQQFGHVSAFGALPQAALANQPQSQSPATP